MKKLIVLSICTLFASLAYGQQTNIPLSDFQKQKPDAQIYRQVYTTGDSVQIANTAGITWLIVNPAVLKSSLKIKLPTRPIENQQVCISYGGTMTTGTVVTTLSVVKTTTAHGILQAAAPTTAVAGACQCWRYGTLKFYRMF